MARAMRVTSTDYRRPYRAAPVALANRVGDALERVGLRPVDLGEASVLAAARRGTGLREFDDESFREPLRRLLDALEREARLHLVGRLIARGNIVRLLSNRLRIDDELRRRPEILEGELEPPLFIVGLQRTGTTVVHRLLALDPAFRFLASWEAINPAPFPSRRRANGGPDPRLRFARIAERSVGFLGPDFYAVHPVAADEPEEDCLLLDLTFMGQTAEATQQVPSFMAWRQEQDHTDAYRYYEKALRHLLWQRPEAAGRWLLKTPAHLEHLGALLEVFPGARLLFTHRDPRVCIASFCSMMAHAYGMFTDEVDPRVVGRRWLDKDAYMMRRALEARDRVGEEPFLDLFYPDLVREPIAQMRRVYRWLGRSLEPALEARMRAWLRDHPQHKHGRHRYGLEHFGLGADEVDRAFADYRERFELPRE